jgi:porphobilinogen synthase
MSFLIERPRRLRRTDTFRRMVCETRLAPEDFILPLFVCPGTGIKKEIPSMPGNYHFSVDTLIDKCREAYDSGIPAVILFGLPEQKDPIGSEASDPESAVPRAIRAIKSAVPDLLVVTDICLCEYTSHGHCGIVDGETILNDPTLHRLASMSLVHAEAGADIVAPSDMMDGRVAAIRDALDRKSLTDVAIMSYAAKYASGFYGPFREAADSAPAFGDRRSYQMDPSNAIEALREVRLDVEEGADIVMVKPALPYLDIIWRVKEMIDIPLAAYNVSGEFAMIKAAASKGWLDESRVMMESLTSIKRAGADIILTYFAIDAAKLLK